MKTIALIFALATSLALCDTIDECPSFDPSYDTTLYHNESDLLGPVKIGHHIYLGHTPDTIGFWRLTNDSSSNLVSDSQYNEYPDTYWFQPINFTSLQPHGQFVHLLDQTATPDYAGHYGFTCDQYGGEGLLTVRNVPAGVNGTNWWFCPVPSDKSQMALKFGVQEGSVPEGCTFALIQGVQD